MGWAQRRTRRDAADGSRWRRWLGWLVTGLAAGVVIGFAAGLTRPRATSGPATGDPL